MTELTALYQHYSKPLHCKPTGIDPVLPHLPEVKVVIFDIYGTLVISGSGDIGTSMANLRESYARQALQALRPDLSLPSDVSLTAALTQGILIAHQEAKAQGVAYPEIDIREQWAPLLAPYGAFTTGEVEQFATIYESLSNPVWPMPYATETLQELTQRGISIGLISNAQFYTPVLLDTFFPASQIAPELSLYSYQHRQAKPGLYLFDQLARTLRQNGVSPAEVLLVGNDMRNDIAPAQRIGFRTALVASDLRSYRPRPEEGYPPADATLTCLSQLRQIL